MPPLPAMPAGARVSVVIVVPVSSDHCKGKPPDVARLTLRSLATDEGSVSPQVTNRVTELFAVVAHELRCKVQPGHVCQTSVVPG